MNRIDGVHAIDTAQILDAPTKRSDVKRNEFIAKFQNIKSDEVRGHLEGLFDKITVQGEKLSERLHLSEVVQYRKLVQEFLDVATKNSHQFSKQNFLDRRGRHRVYCIVKNIDRELDSLTKDFINNEADRISVLKKLDDIRGMLLDVLM